MKYQNQLEKIRDLELELEDTYAELEEDLLDKTEDNYVSNFIRLMFEESNNIEQFRYVLDAFVSYNFYELKLGDKVPENIMNEYGLDTMIHFEFNFNSRTGNMIGYLHLVFNKEHIITDIDSGTYTDYSM